MFECGSMIQSWEQVSEEVAYTGRRKIVKRMYRMPDGRVTDFEIKAEGQTVCIFALTTDQRVILARQFRPGPGKVLLELPGGGLEKGEAIIEAAARELQEETGYRGTLQSLGSGWRCAYSTGLGHHFVATNCERVADMRLDEDEFIEHMTMPLPEFLEHLRLGELTDAATAYRALDHLGLLGC